MIRSAAVQPLKASTSAVRAVALSVLSVVLFAAFAATPGSTFQPILPEGAQPAGPFRWLGHLLRFDHLSGAWLVAVGVLVAVFAVAAFLLLLRETWRGMISVRTTVALGIAYELVVLALPLLFSRDVYSYAFYGRIASVYHANPYVHTPVEFARDPLWALVGPRWVNTPAVYGPGWTFLSASLTRVIDGPAAVVQAFRFIAVAATLATIALIHDTTKRVWPSRAAFGIAAFACNPVVVFHSVASGHNDVLVGLSVIGAFALLVRGRELPAVAVLSLGVLVKATAMLPLLLVLVWCIARSDKGRRARTAFTHVGLAAAIGIVFALPFLNATDPTLGMLELAGHEGWLAPSPSLRKLVDVISFGTLGWLTRVVFALLLVAVVIGLARDVARRANERTPRDLGAAMGWSLVLFMLLGPVLIPWYVMWALPLVWLLPRAPRTALIAAGVGLALAQWSTEAVRYPGAFNVNLWFGRWVVVPVMVVLLIWTLADLWRRLHLGLPLEDPQQVPEAAGHA